MDGMRGKLEGTKTVCGFGEVGRGDLGELGIAGSGLLCFALLGDAEISRTGDCFGARGTCSDVEDDV